MSNPTTHPEGTLIINTLDSSCGTCGKGADRFEKTHETAVSDRPGPRGKGCGVEFLHVTTDHMGTEIEALIKATRPDLNWIPLPEFPRPPDRYN